MADYRTHITVSGLLGVGYGVSASAFLGFNPVEGALAGCLTWISGMLPDLDSESGRPVREVFGVTAALAPMMMMSHLQRWGGTAEGATLLAVLMYIAIRHGAGLILGRLSVHRGMFHSIPAMLIAAEMTYLCYHGVSATVRLLMAGGVALGFASHLVLDEIYSVELSGMKVKLKSSAGSAVKMYGKCLMSNMFAWGLMLTLTYAVITDRGFTQIIQRNGYAPPVQHAGVEGLPRR